MKSKAKRVNRKSAIHWHRPKAKKTDITVTSNVIGRRADIPVLKGGGSLIVYSATDGHYTVETTRTASRPPADYSMGELEAIALIYAKLLETK